MPRFFSGESYFRPKLLFVGKSNFLHRRNIYAKSIRELINGAQWDLQIEFYANDRIPQLRNEVLAICRSQFFSENSGNAIVGCCIMFENRFMQMQSAFDESLMFVL